MKRKQLVAATALIALLVVLSACGSNPAEPDKVVGVLLKCTYPAQTRFDDIGGNYVIPAEELSSTRCEQLLQDAPDRQRAISRANALYVVTVRTSAGGSYTVEVPATTRVRMGQVWPPASY